MVTLSAEGAIVELARRLQKHEAAGTRTVYARCWTVRVDGNNPQGSRIDLKWVPKSQKNRFEQGAQMHTIILSNFY